ncbi:hypothetical protein JJE63_07330 [Alloprevotella tannerae]|uniref:hypothetical protein n=1 Tax=Alloprevotella tannerae TaxID=76122 RepID=UPI001EDA715C|nr:hypothetical protein [Alloprevotella tannerae]MCG2653133.1 hypothetical protein [Alloprevotella tannerae]
MGLFAGESVRCFCGFRRRIAHIPLRVYMGVRENTCKQALRLGLLTPPLSTAAYLYFAGKAQAQLFSLFLRIEISYVCLYLKMASTKPKKKIVGKEFCAKTQFLKRRPYRAKTKVERGSMHY